MKDIDLGTIFKRLGLPVGLVAVFSAILLLFGVELTVVLGIAGGMVGLWAVISLIVNVLKVIGVVDDGTAGKWSAVLNLAALAGIAYLYASDPAFNFPQLDAQLQVIVQFGALILGYVVNVIGTRAMHKVEAYGLGMPFAFGYGAAS